MIKHCVLIVIFALGLTTTNFGQTGEQSPPMGNACAQALAYFEKAQGSNFGDYVSGIRPARVSPAFKAEVIANLPKEGDVQPSAKGRVKLAALEPILAYHERTSAIDIKVFHAGQAFVGLHARSILLISEEALDLLTAEELQASVANEIEHDYFWREYQLAEEQHRYNDVQEIELRCDGIAIITLHRLGLDPSRMISAVTKMTRFNQRIGTMAKAHVYTSLDERRRFNRVMVEMVKSRSGATENAAASVIFAFAGPAVSSLAQAMNERVGKRTAAIISKIDDRVVNEFQKAWLLSGSGFAKTEALVLLYRTHDGSILARSQGKSGEYKQFTFRWTADIIAVVHTHANGDDPEPVGQDSRLADRFGIPVFTITQFGMYVYDPDTRKTSMVQQGLDWLKSTKWNGDRQVAAQKLGSPSLNEPL